jgi:nitroreductase
METREAIHTRRSVRAFSTRQIPEEAVRQLLEAAMQAPSAGNEQPWQFVVIENRSILDAIPDISPYAPMCRTAPLAILVCGDMHEVHHTGYWVQDCSAATQNLLLMAHDLGFGAVWTGVYPNPERVSGFRQLLHLPEEIVPMALVVIGIPEELAPPAPRFNSSRIHHDGW